MLGLTGGRWAWKHWRQSTGRPCVGLKGTVVSTPHAEQLVRVSVREIPAAAGPAPASGTSTEPARLARLATFWIVLKLFVEEKQLFPGGEDELPTTITAGQ